MKKIMLVIAAAMGMASGVFAAELTYVAVGQEGRGYEKRGMAITEQLRDGWDVKNFAGSEAIARAVCNDPDTPLGVAQIDAVRAMEMEGCDLKIIGNYPSQEYAIILFPPDSPLSALHDMNKDTRILVDDVGSGTALFWQTIVGIENGEHGNKSEWAKATPVYDFIDFADSMAESGEIDAVLMVGNPNSNEVHALITAGWNAGELDDKDINDLVFRRGPLYERETVTIDPPGMLNEDTEDAYVVRSFFIANSEWVREQRSLVKRIANIVKAIP